MHGAPAGGGGLSSTLQPQPAVHGLPWRLPCRVGPVASLRAAGAATRQAPAINCLSSYCASTAPNCLARLQWLNDEVINVYISLLLERDADRRKRVRLGRNQGQRKGLRGCYAGVTSGLLLSHPLPSATNTHRRGLAALSATSHAKHHAPIFAPARPGPFTQGVGGPRCHFFNTFFANKLYKDTGYNYGEASGVSV